MKLQYYNSYFHIACELHEICMICQYVLHISSKQFLFCFFLIDYVLTFSEESKKNSFYLDEHFFFALAGCSMHFSSQQCDMNRKIFRFNSIIFTSSLSRTPIELYINESKWMQQIYNTFKIGNTRISFSDHTNIISIQHSIEMLQT